MREVPFAPIVVGQVCMKELSTQIEIEASAQKVWSILTDFSSFSEWNPFITEAEGQIEEGGRLRVRISPPGGTAMTFKPTVIRVVPEQEVRWKGRLLVPGLFDGEHIFEISPIDDRRVRLTQREMFSGLFVPLLWSSLRTNTSAGFEAMNRALKARAESRSTDDAA